MAAYQTFPIFLPNKGPVVNKPEELLSEQFSPYSRNMTFYNELCQGRYGLAKFNQTALNGEVLTIAKFTNLAGTHFLLFATPYDIYSYDFGNARFDILTPIYSVGTIEVKAGELNRVYGSGTPNWSTNLKAGDWIKIGSGAIHTGSTWYKIASVDSNTLLTLTSNAVITAAGTAYVARKTFAGTSTSYWDWVQFEDDVLSSVLLMTNGTPGGFVYWTGTGQVVSVTGTPVGWTACKYLSVFGGRAIMGYTVEGGADQKARTRWSDVANCLSWPDINFVDFADEPTAISGMTKFNGYHVIFKEEEAYVGRFVGGDTVFDWQLSAQAFGARSPYSVVTRNDYIYYYGHDKKFHRFNLLQDDVISEPLFPETKEFDPNFDAFIQGFNVTRLNQVRWFCPYLSSTRFNYVLVWDYQQNIPQVWEYAQADACCSMGTFFRTSDVYADDAIYGNQYADETSGFADDSTFTDGAELVVYGGFDGIVRQADAGTIDDGVDYTRQLMFKKLNLGLFDSFKRLWRQQWWLQSEVSGSVLVRIKLDDKTSYEAISSTVSLENSGKAFIKSNITLDVTAQNFQPDISSTNHFALLGVMNYFFPKRSTIRK